MRVLSPAPRRPFVTVFAVLVLGLALVVPLIPQQVAYADAIETVTNLNDTGEGSLRQAIADVFANGEIRFQDGLTGTITLGSQLGISKNLTIVGPGASNLTVSGAGAHNVFLVGNGSEVSISGLRIADGQAFFGGGVYVGNGSTLRVLNSIITNNKAIASSAAYGGGIYNLGTVFVINSEITGNVADHDGVSPVVGSHNGGGIYNDGGIVSLTNNSIIANNTAHYGGGIYNDGGTVNVTSSAISVNKAPGSLSANPNYALAGYGGGIYTVFGTVNIVNSTISDNEAVWVDAQGLQARGGGIYSEDGTVTITGSTIARNKAIGFEGHAGGIYSMNTTLNITSSTISGNDAPFLGGGIATFNRLPQDDFDATITSSTIANNSSSRGSGIGVSSGDVTLWNTILDNDLTSTNTNCNVSAVGSIDSDGHNLATDATCNLTAGGDLPSTDPALVPLALNGGTTETHAITSTSPAYDAGGNAPCPTPSDQRGAPRPQGGACDIGAFEVGTIAVAGPTLTLPTSTVFAEATGPGGTTIDFSTLVSATDWAGRSLEVECDPELDSTFPITSSPVTVDCDTEDSLGQTAAGSFTVHVRDTTPPTLNMPANMTETATGPDGAIVTFTVTADDVVDPDPQVNCSRTSGSTFTIGTHTITCSASDATGNSSDEETFTITVQDRTGPIIAAVDDFNVEATGPNGATVDYTIPVATDDVDGTVAVDCIPPPGSILAIDTHTITCTAEDEEGNDATPVTFNITVQDTTAPVIAPMDDFAMPATGPDGATVDYTPPAATDTVDGTVAVTCTPPPGSLFSVSTHTVICEAEDEAGNEATPVSFTITVTDDAAPVINPVDDLSVPATDPDGATVNYPLPTASDSVDGMVAVTCLPSSGSRLPIGTTTVTCNAQDSAGNPAIPVSFEVTVLGARAQIVQLSHDIRGMDIPTGPKLTLTIFLRMAAVTAEQRYPVASCRFLETTAGLVTSFTPRFIDRADAADIMADIQRIRTVMRCR